MERAAAFFGVVWLIGAMLVMMRSIRQGQALADKLAERHAPLYASLERPRPGYWHSIRRNRFAKFIADRGYERLDDPVLAAEFEAYRKREARLVVSILISMGALLVLFLGVEAMGSRGSG